MKLYFPRFAFLCVLCVLCVDTISASALDREAFTFTKYDLDVRIEPDQQRLGARGTITLRNDSSTPQKIVVLQVSSSLSWLSIKAGGKQLQFVSQPYTSDIDHTGALSEAIVTLPAAVARKETIDLEIAYEGVIVLDATRLTRMGAPESAAQSADWDRISAKFTAMRGVGYVAWYPIATEAADMTDGTGLSEVIGRWKTRESEASMHARVRIASRGEDNAPELLINAASCSAAADLKGEFVADCTYTSLGWAVPTVVMADYQTSTRAGVAIHYLPGHDAASSNYGDAAEKALPLIAEWFGDPRNKAQMADLPDGDSVAFENGSLLLAPLTGFDAKAAGLAAAHQLTHAAIFSPRPWINEGLAHFAQALYLEQRSGRQAALDYMAAHRSALTMSEIQTTAPHPLDEVSNSLINTADEALYRSKAMYVWWMLREMVGDTGLKKALAAYRAGEDKEPSHMQRLIQTQTQKDLEWFFDDWVYRERGLPDFKVDSAFVRKTLPEGFMLTVTVSNLGAAGAEVPVTVKFTGGEVTQRLVVRGKSSAVTRVQVNKMPEEVVVNDGSVPESDLSNNVFRIPPSDVRESDAAK
jgi:hypothetical protein